MFKVVDSPDVTDVAFAIAKEPNEGRYRKPVYSSYLMNLHDKAIEKVYVHSRLVDVFGGKGPAVLRPDRQHERVTFYRQVAPLSALKIESIISAELKLHNQYWVSFNLGNELFHRRFFFVANSVQEKNFTALPLLEERGILIK